MNDEKLLYLNSYKGNIIDIINPTVDSIDIEDIAHTLSMQCRFGGRIKEFYSVCQHSYLVSLYCAPEDALWGLLHDATEAYLVDIPRPLKMLPELQGYLELEKKFMNVVVDKFNLKTYEMPESVKYADDLLLYFEKNNFMSSDTKRWVDIETEKTLEITAMSHSEAKEIFLKRFYELTNNESL